MARNSWKNKPYESLTARQKLLKSGFTDYMLRGFTKTQNDFDYYVQKQIEINRKYLDTTVFIDSYDYNTLLNEYEHSNLSPKYLLDMIDIKQSDEQYLIDKYGITTSIYDTIHDAHIMTQRYTNTLIDFETDLKYYLKDFNREKYDKTQELMMRLKKYVNKLDDTVNYKDIEIINDQINTIANELAELFF